jgi:hypothetical protein
MGHSGRIVGYSEVCFESEALRALRGLPTVHLLFVGAAGEHSHPSPGTMEFTDNPVSWEPPSLDEWRTV